MRYLVLLLYFPSFLFSQKLENLYVKSEILNRDIEVFVLDYSQGERSPVFYLTDGRKMIENGTARLLDSLTNNRLIPRAKYTFVSTIDPETNEEYRNEYFFCNEKFVQFFEHELIPKMEGGIEIVQPRRYLIGISFGGMNAAFFAAKTNIFQGFSMLSPITYPCEKLNHLLVFSKNKNYKVFISTGKSDAEYYVETLYPILKSKTEYIKLVKTKGGHDFENWNSQLVDLVMFMNK